VANMRSPVRPQMTVQETVDRWPATRAVFERYGIPTQSTSSPGWETIYKASAAKGHWAADQLLGELDQATGGQADIQAESPIVEAVMTSPATVAIFKRYDILCQPDRIGLWETIEQAAAARGHWATDALLEELAAVTSGPLTNEIDS
jgi:hypothetical protein